MKTTAIGLAAALVLLTACGGGDEAGVGGVSKEEAAELNNAAAMVEDASPDSLAAPEDMPLETESNGTATGGNTL